VAAQLRDMGDAALAPLVKIATARGAQTGQRSLACILIGRLRTPAARDWLLGASADKDRGARIDALVGLGELADRGTYPRLLEVLRTDPDEGVRETAATAMGGVEAPESVDVLIGLLGDEHPGMRIGAAWSLGELGDRRAVEPLQRAAADQREAVRVEAAAALRRLGVEPAPLPGVDPATAPLSPAAAQPLDPTCRRSTTRARSAS